MFCSFLILASKNVTENKKIFRSEREKLSRIKSEIITLGSMETDIKRNYTEINVRIISDYEDKTVNNL